MNKLVNITIEPAKPADLPAILGLPKDGLSDHLGSVLVARKGQTVVGSAALELYGNAALLRSVAVGKALQSQGLGQCQKQNRSHSSTALSP